MTVSYDLLPKNYAGYLSSSSSNLGRFRGIPRWLSRIIICLGMVCFITMLFSWVSPHIKKYYTEHLLYLENLKRQKPIQQYLSLGENDPSNEVINDLILELSKGSNSTDDIMGMSLKVRAFKKLYLKKLGNPDKPLEQYESSLFSLLHDKLFPWLKKHKNVDDLLVQASSSRGIVIATGQQYFPMAVHAIRTIRIWKCTLPIEVFYLGKKDLDQQSIDFLNSLENVTAVDIGQVFNNDILQLEGWDIKPFAILGSSFRQVLLMDADVVMAQPPENLFEYEEYKSTGAMFFVDRWLRNRNIDYPQWFKTIIPTPHSKKLKSSQMYQGKTNYEQESGVVLIDKGRRLTGLLATCRLNCKDERKEIHSKTHGDKETFWLGFEISQDPYEFLNDQAGTIGTPARFVKTKEIVLCGHLAHFDKQNNLLWFNDGIVDNKKAKEWKVGNFPYIANRGVWKGLCLLPTDLRKVPESQAKMIDNIKELWNSSPMKSLNSTKVP